MWLWYSSLLTKSHRFSVGSSVILKQLCNGLTKQARKKRVKWMQIFKLFFYLLSLCTSVCTIACTNYAIPVFIYVPRCSGFCFPENTSPSLKPKKSGMSIGSLMTWLLRPWNLKEALSGPARTTMGMCSLTLLHKVWDVFCATLK